MITSGPYEAAVVSTGDPPLGTISIHLRGGTDQCPVTYLIGPFYQYGDAVNVAHRWLELLRQRNCDPRRAS